MDETLGWNNPHPIESDFSPGILDRALDLGSLRFGSLRFGAFSKSSPSNIGVVHIIEPRYYHQKSGYYYRSPSNLGRPSKIGLLKVVNFLQEFWVKVRGGFYILSQIHFPFWRRNFTRRAGREKWLKNVIRKGVWTTAVLGWDAVVSRFEIEPQLLLNSWNNGLRSYRNLFLELVLKKAYLRYYCQPCSGICRSGYYYVTDKKDSFVRYKKVVTSSESDTRRTALSTNSS